METLSLSTELLRMPQVVAAAQMFLGFAVLILLVILAAHIFTQLGRKAFLYRKKPPVDGWNRRFYPAITALLVFVVGLLWWLQSYRNSL